MGDNHHANREYELESGFDGGIRNEVCDNRLTDLCVKLGGYKQMHLQRRAC